uniref:Zinc finger LSD1-type domain-containing protein n=1 Tax=Aegilops tauschii subsp. strangulata TaxID=200361 RepID=A0A453LQU6_AEGTS
MQSQIVCHRCRRVLAYPSGAPSVCCAMCRAITAVPPPAPAVEMAQLICGGCRTLLMYTRNADTVRCSCCSTVNLVRPGNANSASYSVISSYELSTFMLLIHRHVNLSEECGILLICCW